jgi:hypothetical protein
MIITATPEFETSTPAPTATFTPTPTFTPAPYVYDDVDGQTVRWDYTLSVGQVMTAGLLIMLILFIWGYAIFWIVVKK